MLSNTLRKSARLIADDGVIAYPTEGVFGLGCHPDSMHGVARILSIKERRPEMGLVVIAAHPTQLADWTPLSLDDEALATTAEAPVTYVVPATPRVPWWIRGKHSGVAVRIAAHPVASALCTLADTPLVSTSANVSGRPPARNKYVLRRQFGPLVDYVVPGNCGPANGPSEIRVLGTDDVIRTA